MKIHDILLTLVAVVLAAIWGLIPFIAIDFTPDLTFVVIGVNTILSLLWLMLYKSYYPKYK